MLVQPRGDKTKCVRTEKERLLVKVLGWVISLLGRQNLWVNGSILWSVSL